MPKKAKKTDRVIIPYRKLTLANNFMFYKVMRHHPEACKKLLEMLLNIKIKKMTIATEETVKIDFDAKSIRLDVFVKEGKRMYDIELQVANTHELPERSRFYAAAMDLDTLKPGDKYNKLKDSHVIFICMEDVFNNGLAVNTFENICQENGKTKLNDRAYKHFFIAPLCAKIIKDEELKGFFEFLINNKAKTQYTSNLKEYVEDARHNTQWRLQYMTWERQRTYDYEDGKEAGKLEGSQKKAVEAAVTLVQKYHATPETAAKDMDAPLELVLAELEKISVKA